MHIVFSAIALVSLSALGQCLPTLSPSPAQITDWGARVCLGPDDCLLPIPVGEGSESIMPLLTDIPTPAEEASESPVPVVTTDLSISMEEVSGSDELAETEMRITTAEVSEPVRSPDNVTPTSYDGVPRAIEDTDTALPMTGGEPSATAESSVYPLQEEEPYVKPLDYRSHYHHLENQADEIEKERKRLHDKYLEDLETADRVHLQKLAAIELQSAADFDRELTKGEWPKVFDKRISPLERLHRLAVNELQNRNEGWGSRFDDMWLEWYRKLHPDVPFDTRTTPEKLIAYTKARKSGKTRSTPEIDQFENAFADAFLQWYRDN